MYAVQLYMLYTDGESRMILQGPLKDGFSSLPRRREPFFRMGPAFPYSDRRNTMKTNSNDRRRVAREDMAVENLMEQGRLLHSVAVFEMCADMLRRMKALTGGIPGDAEPKAPGLPIPR